MCAAIVSGIISGLISAGIMFFLLFKWKLRFAISQQICRSADDGDYRIKIVNLSRAHAVDLYYSIAICIRSKDDIAHIIPAQLVNTAITDIQEFTREGEHADYAIRIAFRIKEELLNDPTATIVFRCYATHAISGTVSFFSKEYTKDDIVDGLFETGKSLKILDYKPVQASTENSEQKK